MRKKRLTKAVRGLDPGSRALLDLSLRRRVPDDEIADFLGIDAAGVARRRAAALRRLGSDLEIERPEELTGMLVALAALPADAWGVPARPGEVGPVEPPAGRTVEVGGDRRRRAVVVAGVPITALGVLVAMIIAAGGDETLMETGRVQGDSRPAPPVLGEVPTPLPDDVASDGDRRRSSGGGDSSGGPAVASTAVAPSEAAAPPEPEPEVEVKGRQEQGGSEDGDRRRPRARAPEPDATPAPVPAPAPAPAPQAAPAPAPTAPGGGDDGDDDRPDARPPTQGPANGPQLPVPTVPEAPRPPKAPDDGGEDDGDDDRDGGSSPQPAPQQPAQPQDGGGKKSWKTLRLKGKQKKQSPPKGTSDDDGDRGDRNKPWKRGRKRGDD